MNELKNFYQEYKKIQQAYDIALSTLYYDVTTIAPKNGIPIRNQAMAMLSGEAFEKATNPQSLEKIAKLQEITQDPYEQRELELFLKNMEFHRVLPKDVYVAYQQILNDSQTAWEEAIQQNDASLFAPHLETVIQKQKEVLHYVPKQISDYDYLLDRYENGMTMDQYDAFFDAIKTHLVPLIKEIQTKGVMIDDRPLFQSFDIEKQAAFNKQLLTYFKANQDSFIMRESQHPFTEFFSSQEARITTHYYEHNIMSGILSTIHEYGHALYSLQVTPSYDGTALKDGIGFAMHESQSRFLENHIGKHPSFWKVQYPILQEYFPEQLGHISFNEFIKMINVSRPSLIRTEADELTYPLHVLIRYEIEKEIFQGTITFEQLETRWQEKYEAYLGIHAQDAKDGILQDMHWGAGNFGYFPTYALGSAYAAQFFDAMQHQMNVEESLENNEFDSIRIWLKEHIHQYGAYKNAHDILLEATGQAFDPMYYINYLTNKYRSLYEL